MDKPIRVTLKKNEVVAIEAQYTVCLHIYKQGLSSRDETLYLRTVRATSLREAIGMVIHSFRENGEKHSGYVIANFAGERTGE